MWEHETLIYHQNGYLNVHKFKFSDFRNFDFSAKFKPAKCMVT